MNRKRKDIIASCEISEIITCILGGYEQKILIQGKSKMNPIIVFLHGGPGSPLPFSVGSRGMFPEFLGPFTLITWDQLGCGINNYPIDNSFTTDSFTDMTVDLIKAVKEKYPDHSIHLFGVSYGSILCAKAAARVPELLDSVFVYGQIIKNLAFNEFACSELEKSPMPLKIKQQLKYMQNIDTHTADEVIQIAKWIRKYTEGYVSKTDSKISIRSFLWGLMTSPDYTFKDFRATLFNPYAKCSKLMEEIAEIDLTELLEKIQVPYLILQGNKDIVTPTGIVSAYMEKNQNPNLSFEIIEDSAHMPGEKGMTQILEYLCNATK